MTSVSCTCNENLGYIDLSKRRVDPEDVAKCEERYNKAKAVHSVLRHVADMKGRTLESLYQEIGWPLYRKYGHAYDAFKLALGDSEEDIFEGLGIDENTKASIISYVKRRLAPQPVKIRSDIEVTCFTYDGIDAIKEALLEGEKKSVKDAPVKLKLIAPPMYVMTTMTLDKDIGLETLNSAIEAIGTSIRAKG
jgi:translation initiation factor 2 subunit 1